QQGQQTVISPGAPPPAFAPIPPGGLQTTVASFEGPSVNNGNNGGNNGSPGGNGGQGGQGGNGNVGGGNVPGGRSGGPGNNNGNNNAQGNQGGSGQGAGGGTGGGGNVSTVIRNALNNSGLSNVNSNLTPNNALNSTPTPQQLAVILTAPSPPGGSDGNTQLAQANGPPTQDNNQQGGNPQGGAPQGNTAGNVQNGPLQGGTPQGGQPGNVRGGQPGSGPLQGAAPGTGGPAVAG